jgi:hypothetical protein
MTDRGAGYRDICGFRLDRDDTALLGPVVSLEEDHVVEVTSGALILHLMWSPN